MSLPACLTGILLFVALSPLPGAEILTVGPPGGGAQFNEIQAAIDAAMDDDVILVQAGTYAGITVSKPLRILGDGMGSVRIASVTEIGALIQNIAAGEEFVLSAVQVQSTPSIFVDNYAIRISNCPGTVVLHDVLLGAGPAEIGVRVESCDRLVLLSCQMPGAGAAGTAAVSGLDSTLWVADSEIVGTSPPDDLHLLQSGAHGVALESSTLHVWRSFLRGGDGNDVFLEAFGTASPASGVFANNSTVNLYGGPVGEVRGGDGGEAPFFGLNFDGAPGVDLINGSIARIQANLPIAGGFDGAGLVQQIPIRIDATSSFTLDPLVFPTLASDKQEVGIGTGLTLTFEGNPFAFQVLFLSVHTGPTLTLAGVEGIGLLDSTQLRQLATITLDGTGMVSLPATVPPIPALLGMTLFFQAVEANGAQLAISNPILVTVTS